MGWEHFPHEADMGVRGIGATTEQAFEQGALAMTALITDPCSIRAQQAVSIEGQAPDEELLFVQWLNGLIYEMATRHMLFGAFKVRIDGTTLHGEAWGEPVDVQRHHPAVEVKGATLTTLKVRHEGGRCIAQTVVDV